MVAVFVIVLLLAAILYPTVSALILKMRMLSRLKRLWTAKGFRCRRLKRLPCLARSRSDRYEMVLENERCIVLIKLWTSRRRDETLLIYPDGRVSEQRTRFLPLRISRSEARRPYRTLPRRVPKTVPPELKPKGRRVIPVLLIYPSYREILAVEEVNADTEAKKKIRQKKRRALRTVRLGTGDLLFGKRISSPSGLEKMLCALSVKREKQTEKEPSEQNSAEAESRGEAPTTGENKPVS